MFIYMYLNSEPFIDHGHRLAKKWLFIVEINIIKVIGLEVNAQNKQHKGISKWL